MTQADVDIVVQLEPGGDSIELGDRRAQEVGVELRSVTHGA
jgi:hypothetical protein